MEQHTVRKWEHGIAFIVFIVIQTVLWLTCCVIAWIKHAMTFPIILFSVFILSFWAHLLRRLISLWRTRIVFSPEGIRITNGKAVKEEYAWYQIKKIYLNESDIANSRGIVFAEDALCDDKPFDSNWRKLDQDPNFLFWMYYTKEKEELLRQFAENKIVKAKNGTRQSSQSSFLT